MTVPNEYDPLLAKVIAHGRDRIEAISRMRRALEEMRVAGIPTSLPFHRFALLDRDFNAGRYGTTFITRWDERGMPELTPGTTSAAALAAVLATRARAVRRSLPVTDAPWTRAAREDALR
jgi:acetyl/propionyl-CoA carboxylase alpha subunit